MLVPKPIIIPLLLFLLFSCDQEQSSDPLIETEEGQELKSTFEAFQKSFSDHEVAYGLLERVKTLAEDQGNQEYLAKHYAGYGYLKRQERYYDEAVTSYQQALDIYKALGDSLHQGWVLNNLGFVFRLGNMPEQALTYFHRAEDAYKGVGRQDKLLGLYENIGLTFLDHGNYEVAEDYLQKGLQLSQEEDNNEKIAVFNNLFGKLYFKQGYYDEARTRYLEALDFVKNQLQKAYTYGNIAETYLLEQDPNAAKEWIAKAMQLKEKIENADTRPNLNYMGMYQAQKGNCKEALILFDQVVEQSAGDLLEKELAVAIKNANSIYKTQSSLRTDESFRKTLYYSDILHKRNELLLELQVQLQALYDQSLIKKGEADYADLVEQKKQAEQKAVTHMWYGGLITLTLVLFVVGVGKLKRISKEREAYRVKVDHDIEIARNLRKEMIERGYLEEMKA